MADKTKFNDSDLLNLMTECLDFYELRYNGNGYMYSQGESNDIKVKDIFGEETVPYGVNDYDKAQEDLPDALWAYYI